MSAILPTSFLPSLFSPPSLLPWTKKPEEVSALEAARPLSLHEEWWVTARGSWEPEDPGNEVCTVCVGRSRWSGFGEVKGNHGCLCKLSCSLLSPLPTSASRLTRGCCVGGLGWRSSVMEELIVTERLLWVQHELYLPIPLNTRRLSNLLGSHSVEPELSSYLLDFFF